eukprot:1141414-Pelagomonas_calceolata.AAC.5
MLASAGIGQEEVKLHKVEGPLSAASKLQAAWNHTFEHRRASCKGEMGTGQKWRAEQKVLEARVMDRFNHRQLGKKAQKSVDLVHCQLLQESAKKYRPHALPTAAVLRRSIGHLWANFPR